MPIYSIDIAQRKVLSPLNSKVVTLERIERLLTASVLSFQASNPTPFDIVEMHISAVENHPPQGHFVAPYIEFMRVTEGGKRLSENEPRYRVALLAGKLDARVCTKPKSEGPWHTESPTVQEYNNYYKPIESKEDLFKLEALFKVLEKEALEKFVSISSEKKKKSAFKKSTVKPELLREFMSLIGSTDDAATVFVENHLIASVQKPFDYLLQENRLSRMSIQQCKNFSWFEIFLDIESHFIQTGKVVLLDWKSNTIEITKAINRSLSALFPGEKYEVQLGGDNKNLDSYRLLSFAEDKLRKLKLSLVYLGHTGDSYVFTLARLKDLKKFQSLGTKIGIKVDFHE